MLPPPMPPFAKNLKDLLKKTYTGDDEQQCTAARYELWNVLRNLPDCAPAIFEWLMDNISGGVPEKVKINMLRTLSTVMEIEPATAPKALDRLSAVICDTESPQEVRSAAQQVLNVAQKIIPSAVTWSGGQKVEDDEDMYVHCPLCHCSTIYPEKDGRIPAIMFLDMDGVLMPVDRPLEKVHALLKKLFPHVENYSYTDAQYKLAFSRHLNEKALENFHHMIEQVEASGQRPLVVISSAWRSAATLEEQRTSIYAQHKFSRYLGGKTAIESEFEASFTPECKLGFNFFRNAQERYKYYLE
ncbi:MAG: hypothetical protein AAFP93_02860 [Bacteroidota bacterium]